MDSVDWKSVEMVPSLSSSLLSNYDPGLERMQLSEPMLTQLSEQHTGPWRYQGHIEKPGTRPIEDLAERTKILLAKKGASTHAPALPETPTLRTWSYHEQGNLRPRHPCRAGSRAQRTQ